MSEWGHDFRPDYLRLGTVVEALGHPTVLALTATAAPPVRREIVERLGMRDPSVVVTGFDRPNIRARRRAPRGGAPQAARRSLEARPPRPRAPGIVYAATRRETEEVAAGLQRARRRRRRLPRRHGAERREATERDFMDDRVRRDRGDDRVRHGHRQAERPVRVPPRHQRFARRLLPGDRPLGTRRPSRPRDALLPRRRTSAGGGSSPRAARSRPISSSAWSTPCATTTGRSRPTSSPSSPSMAPTPLATALTRLEDAGAVRLLPDGRVAAGGAGRDLARGRRGHRRGAGAPPFVRPVPRRDDAALRRGPRLPAGVPPQLLRRAVPGPLRQLRQLRRRGSAPAPATCRSPSSRAWSIRMGNRRRPALRGRHDGRAVRRGRLPDALDPRRRRTRPPAAGGLALPDSQGPPVGCSRRWPPSSGRSPCSSRSPSRSTARSRRSSVPVRATRSWSRARGRRPGRSAR